MPSQVLTSVENNFTKGFVTEFTGLNFPENAATDSDNTEYTIVGDVIRREGIDIEVNGVVQNISRTGSAISEYKWNNAGGDGLTQLVVKQVGGTIYFYKSSSATITSPLSTQFLGSTIVISNFVASGNTLDPSIECQFADGNGYLFIFHPQCDPFFCSFTGGTVIGTPISLSIRDFAGLFEVLPVNVRPAILSNEHLYNLINQGWTKGNPWQAASSSLLTVGTGTQNFIVPASLGATNGDLVSIVNGHQAGPGGVFQLAGTVVMSGTVTNYAGTTLTINVTTVNPIWTGTLYNDWLIYPINHGYITTWNTAEGNYPSNSDVWWYFKNTSGVFDPTTTQPNVDLSTGKAPGGSILLNPFRQTRTFASSITGITDIITQVRPKTGCWFQGRVWYTGVDDSFAAQGDAVFTTWTENIYFSQIVQSSQDFGKCYQTNDPTSQQLFGLLPTDGGVIQIQGSGSIYKLFPLMNAMLVFAANGVWYISGSQGIGFSASDFSIVKLSAVRSISSTSFVDINGLPIFWNEEGIYQVEPAKQGQSLLNTPLHVNPLEVTPLTIGTILSFYNNIPFDSKRFVRGAYDAINYTVQWVYKSIQEVSVTDRYTYDKILNYNTANKAFFPYTVDTSKSSINGIIYVANPGGVNSSLGTIKYVSSNGSNIYWADEHDTTFVDWLNGNSGGVNYVSTFTTGFKLHGQGQRRFQVPYILVYSRLGQPVAYYIQSLFDYPINTDSGKWSVLQQVNINSPNFGMRASRIALRGHGLVLQIKITSVDGQPFDLLGWSMYETQNTGI